MTIYNVWGSHLGSSQLFQDHLQRRQRITEFVEKMQARYKQDLASLSASQTWSLCSRRSVSGRYFSGSRAKGSAQCGGHLQRHGFHREGEAHLARACSGPLFQTPNRVPP
ncbi:F-box only protein 25 [Caligus rogercresseyi]|uniref:F-box only protein 25 n=1 Tax=Caligus rogercresseyi TaxID=217165 RepID=A0A7T8HIV5_CALRO|nr:F-box only protein 25 [Caligus rogercresseyi]